MNKRQITRTEANAEIYLRHRPKFHTGWVWTMLLEIELIARNQYRLRAHPITTAEGLLAEYNRSALFRHLEGLSWGMVIEDTGIVIPGLLESVGV